MTADPLGAFVLGPRLRLPGRAGGPLSGLTFVAKDLFDVAGQVTGCGNPDWAAAHGPATRHAWAVGRLLDAGAALAGKTVTCEISLGILGFNRFHGTPRNPRAPGHFPGGSSSGSAAAVAGGLVDLALGSDSGGSVRVPASFCGLIGIRPSHGRVPVDGLMTQSPSLDTVGWLARDAPTFARAAEVLLGTAIPAWRPAELLIAEDALAVLDERARPIVRAAIADLAPHFAGAQTVTLAEGALGHWSAERNILQRAEIWQTFGSWVTATNPRFAFNVARTLHQASTLPAEAIERARATRAAATRRLRELLEPGAILCLPTTPFPAPPLDLPLDAIDAHAERIMTLTSPAGLAGIPQLSLPLAEVEGRPLGLSFLAWRHGDERLVALAGALLP